jgi:hypothetical protein
MQNSVVIFHFAQYNLFTFAATDFDSSSVVHLSNWDQINQHDEIAPPEDAWVKWELLRRIVEYLESRYIQND